MSDPQLLPHTDALMERVETWPALANVSVGKMTAPKSSDGSLVVPAAILYLRPGGMTTGTLCAPDSDAWLPFQWTCTGTVADHAEWVADEVHAALTSAALVVAGRFIGRLKRMSFGAAAKRDDDVSPPVFYVPVEYRLLTITSEE